MDILNGSSPSEGWFCEEFVVVGVVFDATDHGLIALNPEGGHVRTGWKKKISHYFLCKLFASFWHYIMETMQNVVSGRPLTVIITTEPILPKGKKEEREKEEDGFGSASTVVINGRGAVSINRNLHVSHCVVSSYVILAEWGFLSGSH